MFIIILMFTLLFIVTAITPILIEDLDPEIPIILPE